MTAKDQALAAYNLNSSQVDIEKIHDGLINSTWCVRNSSHSYILQKVNHQVFKNPERIASNISLIAAYLLEHHPEYLFVAPLKTKSNEEMVKINGNEYFRLIPFVEGSFSINTVEKPEQAFEAASKFGEFTRILSDFPVEKLEATIPDFHNLSLRYRQFKEALKTENKARLKQSSELIQFMEDHKNVVDIYENILENPSFKLRVTHHDTKISNVLFNEENKGLCVIDLTR